MAGGARQRQRDAENQLRDQTNLLPRKQLLVVYAVLACSLFTTFVDQNGVSTMLPSIARDFNAQATISWAGTANLIANTTTQVLYGRLSDLFGRKLVFMSTLGLLAFSDLMCGLSQNAPMFYAFRGLAGVAGGGTMALSMMIVSDIVSLERRGKYQGILGSAIGLGNVVGPMLGAVFAEKTTWRALFYMLTPLTVMYLVLNWFLLPQTMPPKDFRQNAKKIDYLGSITSSLALILLLIPISGGGSYFDWDSPMVISMLVLGGLLFVAFLFVEWKIANLPIIPFDLYRNKAISAMTIQNFFYGAIYYSNLYYLPLYFQNVRLYSPIISAACTISFVIGQSFVSALSGLYVSRFKRYGEVIWAGFFWWTVSEGLLLLFNRTLSVAAMIVILVINGGSVGLVFQPTLVAMQAHCTKQQRAVVISNRNFIRSVGGAVGLAISAAILQNQLKSSLPDKFKYLALSTYATPDFSNYSPQDTNAILDAYAKASHAVFMLGAPFLGACLLCCFFVKDRGLVRPGDEQPPPQPETQTVDPDVEKGNTMTDRASPDVDPREDEEKVDEIKEADDEVQEVNDGSKDKNVAA